MLTPNSGPAPYCSPAQFIGFYDTRQVGDLVRDDSGRDSPSDLLVDPTLAQHLLAASGEVEGAALRGGRYAPADLAALVAVPIGQVNPQSNGAAFLARLVADLAYGTLRTRRGMAGPVPPEVAAARATVEALGRGEAILPFLEVEAAGHADDRMRTLLELDAAGLLTRSSAARRFLGRATPGGLGYGYGPGCGPGC